MANWVEPKSNYVATDQVTPDIFNTLAENEKFLYEIRCPMEVQDSDGNVTKINSLVFVETTTDGVYKAKYKKSDGTLVEIPIESAQTVKLRSARSIGIQGLTAESASFNGTSAVKIKVTGVPAELLSGIGAIDITGNAATATEATHAASADNATYAEHADTSEEATITQQNLNTLETQIRNGTIQVGRAVDADHATNADSASNAGYATSAGTASTATITQQNLNTLESQLRSGGTIVGHAEWADEATSASSAATATKLSGSWTAYNTSNYLSYGTYIFQVVIDDQNSQVGGHAVSFSDIIVVNSYAYNGLNSDYRYNNDYITGANHIYNANAHEAAWYRTARLKVSYMSSSQFKINLYVTESGGYATTGTDVNGKQAFAEKLASSMSGITYQIYYKKIM